MSPPDRHHRAMERLARRRRQGRQRESAGSFFRSLSMVGGLGWMIVLPTLAGVAIGHWLDRRLGTGIFWTGPMLVLGLVIGCRLAWKRIHRP